MDRRRRYVAPEEHTDSRNNNEGYYNDGFQRRKRMNFDEFLTEQKGRVDGMGYPDIIYYRDWVKKKISQTYESEKRGPVREGKQKYLLGKRDTLKSLLFYTEQRLESLFGNTGGSDKGTPLSKAFMDAAENILPRDQFQRIYGAAMMHEEGA